MGNWRTVNIVGTIDPDEVAAVRAHLRLKPDGAGFGPLTITGGLCGLGDWPAAEVDVCGNLAERNYSVHDVYDALWALVNIAPSVNLRVHCGGDYESEECVATITAADGLVFEHDPEVATVSGVGLGTMWGRLAGQLVRKPQS